MKTKKRRGKAKESSALLETDVAFCLEQIVALTETVKQQHTEIELLWDRVFQLERGQAILREQENRVAVARHVGCFYEQNAPVSTTYTQVFD
jgi:hypothetical protein